jgi:sugar fermentation stimulation protein A
MARYDHRYPTALEEARLIRRYKRFLADVERPDGSILTVHCANPGAMTGCNTPGSPVRIRDSGNPKRKLPYSLEQVKSGRAWVCVNTALPNAVVAAALSRGAVPGLPTDGTVRSEVADGHGSRIDFLVETDDRRCWVEVKSVTLRVGSEARFPDSVTERGRKHLAALERQVEAGDRAVMLFLVGRADTHLFRPAWEIDPAYARALGEAVAHGVEVLVMRSVVSRGGLRAGPGLAYDLSHA